MVITVFRTIVFLGVLLFMFMSGAWAQSHNISAQRKLSINYLEGRNASLITNWKALENDLLSIYEEAIAANNLVLAKNAAFSLGAISLGNQRNETAVRWYSRLFNGSFPLSKKDSAEVLYHLRVCYVHLGAYEKALEMHYLFQPMASIHLGETELLTDADVLAKIQLELGNYGEAIENYRVLIKNTKHLKLVRSYAMYENDIGVCYEKMAMPDSALHYYKKSEKIIRNELLTESKQVFDSFFLALVRGNQGQVMAKAFGKYKEAIPILENDLYYSKKVKDYNNVILTNNHLADVYLSTRAYDKCLKHSQNAIYWANKAQIPSGKIRSFKNKAACFREKELKDSAIFYLEKSISITDSIDKAFDTRRSFALQAAYEVEQSERKLKEQRKLMKMANSALDEKLSQNNRIILVSVLLSVSLIMLLIAYLQKRSRERKLNLVYAELDKQKQIIEAALKEKNSLLKEVHHRVKNNLQVISSLFELQAFRTNDEKLKQSIVEGQNRVKTMALIHQKLYQTEDLKNLPLKSYLEDLANTLISTYARKDQKITLVVNSEKINFSMDMAIPLGLIVNELISNSLKYAFDDDADKPTITIVVKELFQNSFFLKVSDNGKGLPGGFDINELNSLGMKLIRILTQQIDAEWSLSGDEGTVFIMKFKTEE